MEYPKSFDDIKYKVQELSAAAGNVLPSNLIAIAKIQKVKAIELRPMLFPEGGLRIEEGGFSIFIRTKLQRSFNVDNDPDIACLSSRERFTLAHEIAHTLFFNVLPTRPLANKTPRELEQICNKVAGHFLIPERLLIEHFDPLNNVSIEKIIHLAGLFKASVEVLIRRIGEVSKVRPTDYGLALARKIDNKDAKILAVYFNESLLTKIERPKGNYSLISEWPSLSRFLTDEFWNRPSWERIIQNSSGTLRIRKKSHSHGRYFIELVAER
jgi:hypothetical protein